MHVRQLEAALCVRCRRKRAQRDLHIRQWFLIHRIQCHSRYRTRGDGFKFESGFLLSKRLQDDFIFSSVITFCLCLQQEIAAMNLFE